MKETLDSYAKGPSRGVASNFVGEPRCSLFGALHAELVFAAARVIDSEGPLLSHV